MPLYDWTCEKCGANREVLRPMRDCLQPEQCDCGMPMVRQITAAMVCPDIAPYRAVTGDKAGQQIGSRRAHREFLKRNRLIEVGDAPIRDTKQMRHTVKKGEIREELRRVVPDVLRKRKKA